MVPLIYMQKSCRCSSIRKTAREGLRQPHEINNRCEGRTFRLRECAFDAGDATRSFGRGFADRTRCGRPCRRFRFGALSRSGAGPRTSPGANEPGGRRGGKAEGVPEARAPRRCVRCAGRSRHEVPQLSRPGRACMGRALPTETRSRFPVFTRVPGRRAFGSGSGSRGR